MENAIHKDIYTYEDYLKFPEGARVELINGNIYAMSPAPSRIHQALIVEISTEINNFLRENKSTCQVYVAPFDVVLCEEEAELKAKNTVQPDISVVCDKSKLTDRGCSGAPDLIIEIVSAFNASNDYVKKLNLYQDFKVKEYWIINPKTKNTFVYILNEDGFYDEPSVYGGNSSIEVNLFKGLSIDLKEIFHRV